MTGMNHRLDQMADRRAELLTALPSTPFEVWAIADSRALLAHARDHRERGRCWDVQLWRLTPEAAAAWPPVRQQPQGPLRQGVRAVVVPVPVVV